MLIILTQVLIVILILIILGIIAIEHNPESDFLEFDFYLHTKGVLYNKPVLCFQFLTISIYIFFGFNYKALKNSEVYKNGSIYGLFLYRGYIYFFWNKSLKVINLRADK